MEPVKHSPTSPNKSRARAGGSHQPICLARKVEIIKAVESSKKLKSAIAEEFGVAKSMVTKCQM